MGLFIVAVLATENPEDGTNGLALEFVVFVVALWLAGWWLVAKAIPFVFRATPTSGIQCASCWRYLPVGATRCWCGYAPGPESASALAPAYPGLGAPVIRYGSIGSTAISWARWSVMNNRWLVPGVTRPHELRIDSGTLGFGPIHVRVDGQLVATFQKPNRKQPATWSTPMAVDGYEAQAYAQTVKGMSVYVDLFVNGWSLLDGSPISVLSGRAAAAPWQPSILRANRAYAADRLSYIVSAGEMWPVIRYGASLRLIAALICLAGGNLLVFKAGAFSLRWIGRRGKSPATTIGRVAVYVLAGVGLVAVLGVALLIETVR